ncbi:MAG: Gfo/Idh/MocA family oxidoreductase [Pseudomonadota bacterium]
MSEPVGLGIVGCGYVFDLYMATMARHPGLRVISVYDRDPARVAAVTAHYGLAGVGSLEGLLGDPAVEIVVNLTSVASHETVTRAALVAGKHVFCEKPFTTTLEAAQALVSLAEGRGLRIATAPANPLAATAQTLWKAVEDGAVGPVRLIYAEFDDNPVYLLGPENWRSASGAPWPYLDEYATGCTLEHAGYHLSWMCMIFGPVRSVTAFSKVTVPDKTAEAVERPDTPDFSVGCLDFASGVTARVTFSIGAPLDHRMRIIGRDGQLSVDTYRNDRCPVRLERFSDLSLKARNLISVRTGWLLKRLFGADGRAVALAESPPPGRDSLPALDDGKWWRRRTVMSRLRRREMGSQDKTLGIAELADALRTDRPHFPGHDMILHVTELTLALQAGGTDSGARRLTTSFEPPALPARTRQAGIDYRAAGEPGWMARLMRRAIGGRRLGRSG